MEAVHISSRRGDRRAFTLLELLVSVALFVVAISIALFATIGSNSLIQRTDSRSVIGESGRNLNDQLRRIVANAPVGGVQLNEPYNQDGKHYAVVRVKSFAGDRVKVVCESIGRATINLRESGEESYEPSKQGELLAYWIHQVDSGLNCPNISSPPLFQNRLTDPKARVVDFKLHIVNASCSPPRPTCVIKQLLRYDLTVESKRKIIGRSAETARPSITVRGAVAIGLINETLLPLNVETSTLPEGTAGANYGSVQLLATGGVPPYIWELASGPLPPGLNLSPQGIISGTPTAAGVYNFVVRVTDSASGTAVKALSIVINTGGGGGSGGGGTGREGGSGGGSPPPPQQPPEGEPAV